MVLCHRDLDHPTKGQSVGQKTLLQKQLKSCFEFRLRNSLDSRPGNQTAVRKRLSNKAVDMPNRNLHRTFTILGCGLLIAIAGLHGSGLGYVKGLVDTSDLADFVKSIFPVLFAHPSLQLLGLAALGLLSLRMKHDFPIVRRFIGAMVLVDVVLAAYLSAWIPGVILLVVSLLFLLASQRGAIPE